MRRVGLNGLKGKFLYSKHQHWLSFRGDDFGKMDFGQDFTQRLYTFPKKVLSCLLNPDLISNETINPDARMRAKSILDKIVSIGCYSQAAGFAFIRKSVCEHIARVDCVPEPSMNNILLIGGISQGLHVITRSIITNRNDAIMIPTPSSPAYATHITRNQGHAVPYELDRNDNWQINEEQLEDQYQLSRKSGKNIKAIIVNNPSIPTGVQLSVKSLSKLLKFAVTHRLPVIADEIYADPLRTQKSSFASCRKVLQTLKPEIRNQCELISLHSVYRRLMMYEGCRGDYLSFHNIDPFVTQQLAKTLSFVSLAGTIGQLSIQLIVNPDFCASQATKFVLEAEHESLLSLMKSNGRLIKKALSEMTNIHCNLSEQAIFAYPQVTFSKKVIEAVQQKGMKIDAYYCEQMLKNTGTALVPGSYFSQSSASHHFRLSNMILPPEQLKMFLSELKRGNQKFHQKPQH